MRAETGGGFQAQNAGERPEFCSQTALRLANRPKLREFLWTRKPMVEKDGFEPEVSLAVSPTAQSPLSPLRPWFASDTGSSPLALAAVLSRRVGSLRSARTLLGTRPSLRPALVLGASRVFRLAISFGIEATGLPRSAQEPLAGLTPSSCRSPLGQSAGSSLQTAACKRRKKTGRQPNGRFAKGQQRKSARAFAGSSPPRGTRSRGAAVGEFPLDVVRIDCGRAGSYRL